jgi:hypothetical protein
MMNVCWEGYLQSDGEDILLILWNLDIVIFSKTARRVVSNSSGQIRVKNVFFAELLRIATLIVLSPLIAFSFPCAAAFVHNSLF